MIPHLTESYNCSQDPDEADVPYCVLKSFPYSEEHAAIWAEKKVSTLVKTKPSHFNDFWNSGDDHGGVLSAVERGDPELLLIRPQLGLPWDEISLC